MTRLGLASAVLLLACTTGSGARKGGIGEPRSTQVGRYLVQLDLDPEPPPLGELFRVHATVTLPDGRAVETANVNVDARMPQHEHGMETRPRLRTGECAEEQPCRHANGLYIFDGFKFHMGGNWTFLIEIEGPAGPDSTSLVYRVR